MTLAQSTLAAGLFFVLSAGPDAGHRVWPDAPICSGRQDCVFDARSNTCSFNPGQGEWGPMFKPATTCACKDDACVVDKIEPVSCRTYKDCSYSKTPFLHPVSSKEVKRAHPNKVRPCVDDEMDAVCNPESKTCVLEAWKC
jgi:hypothetical protein